MYLSIIPYFDLFAVFFIILTLVQLNKLKIFRQFTTTYALFFFSFFVFGLIQFFNVLEHFNITNIFDPFEDYLEIIIIPLLIFSFYSLYLNIELIKRKETEDELKLALDKANESNLLKSSFLANMSHEIRTPMNAILGFTELILKDDLSKEKRMQFGEIVENNSKLLLSLINDIIDISKIESGQLEIVQEEFDLNKQLQEIYRTFENQVTKKSLEFRLGIDEELKDQIVNSDSFRIQQIFTNLLTNAIKFTDKGYIEMGAVLKFPYIEFYVKDTGEGISDDEKEVIFERFMQSKKQDVKKVQKGTGLGLAISKALAMKLGGEIGVVSNKEKGVTFFFTIPHRHLTSMESLNQTGDIISFNGDWSKFTILVAEDEDFNTILFEEIFRPAKANLIYAKTGEEAVDLIKMRSDIDLVLMDIKMPGFGGLEATKEIRKFNKKIPIIAQTAYAMVGDKDTAIKAGCNDYIAKPFKPEEIIALAGKYINNEQLS